MLKFFIISIQNGVRLISTQDDVMIKVDVRYVTGCVLRHSVCYHAYSETIETSKESVTVGRLV